MLRNLSNQFTYKNKQSVDDLDIGTHIALILLKDTLCAFNDKYQQMFIIDRFFEQKRNDQQKASIIFDLLKSDILDTTKHYVLSKIRTIDSEKVLSNIKDKFQELYSTNEDLKYFFQRYLSENKPKLQNPEKSNFVDESPETKALNAKANFLRDNSMQKSRQSFFENTRQKFEALNKVAEEIEEEKTNDDMLSLSTNDTGIEINTSYFLNIKDLVIALENQSDDRIKQTFILNNANNFDLKPYLRYIKDPEIKQETINILQDCYEYNFFTNYINDGLSNSVNYPSFFK